MEREVRLVGNSGRRSLYGRKALVTGGSRGIGRAVVEELAKSGASVYTCSRNEAELNKCLEQWQDNGFVVSGLVCDLSSPEERVILIEQVISTFNGKLDILVNNVGTNIRKPTIEYTAEEYSKVLTTNLDSAYHLCQLSYPLLIASGKPNIVLTSYFPGLPNVGSGSIYAVSEAAMNQLTEHLACEWVDDNISMNCVVATWSTRLYAHADKEYVEEILSQPPPLHCIAKPNQMSLVVASLCMLDASFISGLVISIDDAGMTNEKVLQPSMTST